jgi:hypothetical protein
VEAERDQHHPDDREDGAHHRREDREGMDVGIRQPQPELLVAGSRSRHRQARRQCLRAGAAAAAGKVDGQVVHPVAGACQALQRPERQPEHRE